jgi:type I restriction enzyme S subunit
MTSKIQSRFKMTELGKIPEDWQIGAFEEDVTIRGRIGWRGYKRSDLRDSGPSVIGGTDLKSSYFITTEVKHLSKEKYNESPDIMLKKGDVLLVTRGNLADVGFFDGSIGEATINPSVIILSEFKGDSRFLFYYLISPQGKRNVLSLSSGSSVPAIYQADVRKLKYPKPPLDEQKGIANFLLEMDKKIEVNRRINMVLDRIGRLLFKRWFVDFEFPNEEGKPYKSSGGAMSDSESGKIPENWSVKKVGDILELAYGRALKDNTRKPGKIPVYGSNGQIGWHNEWLARGPGIIVGRKGNPGTVIWSNEEFFPIDTTFYVVTKGILNSLFYIFHALQRQNLPSLSADSAVPGLNRNVVYANHILVPSSEIISEFDSIIAGMRNLVQNNNEQNLTLSLIRDNLLPNFMCGKIRVPVSQGDVEAP